VVISTKKRKPYSKGKKYPSFALQDAEDMIRSMFGSGRNEIGRAELASELGTTENNDIFKKRLATCRWFGLCNKGTDPIQATDVALGILSGDDDTQMLNRVKAFANVPYFKDLYLRYKGKNLPSRKSLAGILRKEHKISSRGKEILADNFIESGEFAGLIELRGDKLFVLRNDLIKKTRKKNARRKRKTVSRKEERETLEGLVSSLKSGLTTTITDGQLVFPININIDSNTEPRKLRAILKTIKDILG